MDLDRLRKNKDVQEAIENAKKSPLLRDLHKFLMGTKEDDADVIDEFGDVIDE